ncbi:isochorismate pyruvate-lyase [Sphingobacterium olei]|uniref:chorismate mutase n=1 Tax=Sphingobacterium olei TaxID=2571155 RepID=A0A4U0P050_9SPHI|nr:chorismate mutase [Sphingobacterium olei]TJZ60505.1 isochorismate pyruvate-lyase [Sphingobacterium olei]
MIRPLEYCQNGDQIAQSIDTIDYRILELIALRKAYVDKATHFESVPPEADARDQVEKMLKLRYNWAAQLTLDKETVHTVFQTIINHFKNKELELLHEQ